MQLKAPGPYRFPARFFQQNWEFMKLDVIKDVRSFLRLESHHLL
jgi:hypothetical protein